MTSPSVGYLLFWLAACEKRGMVPAHAIHVIRSVPSEMRGSQDVNGPPVLA